MDKGQKYIYGFRLVLLNAPITLRWTFSQFTKLIWWT